MDFASCSDCMEGLRHRFMNCTVESGTRSSSDTNLKGITHMPADSLPEKKGHVAHQLDEQHNERKCVRGAFGIIATTGSRKLWRRMASSHHKLSDSGGRFWEELSVHPDLGMNSPSDRRLQKAPSSVIHLREELEKGEPKSFEGLETWSSPSKGTHYDIDMELTNDVQMANESLHTETVINVPQRLSKTSELPKGLGFFADDLAWLPDNSLLMDVETSESDWTPSTLGALLPQPLLAEPGGDIVMNEERKLKKSKEMSILERVGETLRQKKLRATQA
ncbi:uncharacterized protein LOC121928873 isoform X2 [Sceloporus undulatus]|uniref:uncharacterized protein LOC121928873 isoform X2 n=1 Tax=Sceloporus undulatus TaxID=8520 RepID=UPI001C4BA469|nr:uncharacterized protein LOC121928873 isoform X2 [Sceloporus undulatus]